MEITKNKMKHVEPDLLDPALVLTIQDLTELSGLMGKRITDRETLVHAMKDLSTVSVEGVEINLEYRLLTRLKSRCLDKDNFPRWLREVVIRQLHDYAGW
jgi:hypothetical protein